MQKVEEIEEKDKDLCLSGNIDSLEEQWSATKKMEEVCFRLHFSCFFYNFFFFLTSSCWTNYCERDRVILRDISAMREHSDGRLHTYVLHGYPIATAWISSYYHIYVTCVFEPCRLTELYLQFDQEIMKFTNFLYAIASQRRTPPSSSNEVKQ